MIVMKFGGTSVGDGERIQQVAEIIKVANSLPALRLSSLRSHGERVRKGAVHGEFDQSAQSAGFAKLVVVISAMSGVTDALIETARASASHNIKIVRRTAAELSRQHREATEAVALPEEREALLGEVEALIEEFESLCRAIHVLGELTPRGLDAVASLGERLSVRLVAAALRKADLLARAIEATELVVTDDNYGAASPLMEATREKTRAALFPLLDEGQVPVVTGFIGATPEGVITTLGRGGSDYSAAILGACLDADEVWIWTDVDGVMTADPRIVPNAQTLPEISYAEAAELSYFGAKVLHPKTILPAVERGIPIRIVNTFNPTGPSTLIVAQPKPDERTVKGITSIKGLSLITVEGRGMLGVPGIAAKVFSAVAGEEISALMISQSSSEQNICFVICEKETERALAALEAAFELELARRNVDRIWAQRDVAIVAAVGAGMKGTPGIAAKVFGALGKRGINVISIAQGSSEYNISLVVKEDEAEEAVRAIHKEFGLEA